MLRTCELIKVKSHFGKFEKKCKRKKYKEKVEENKKWRKIKNRLKNRLKVDKLFLFTNFNLFYLF